MLSLLRISQFALIDEIEIEFSEGLNLLTGETGSGKSIIVDALSALVGSKVSPESIKKSAEIAKIEGLFYLDPNDSIYKLFRDSGLDLKEEILIRREILRSGKSKSFVNEKLVTQSFLKDLGRFLVDIHSQGEQISLFYPSTHLEILDEYANLKNTRALLTRVFDELSSVSRQLDEIRRSEAQRFQMIDLLRFQIEEIKKANLQVGEEEALYEERKRLLNVEKLSALSQETYYQLYENEDSAISKVDKVIRLVSELSEYKTEFKSYLEHLQNALAVFEDLAAFIRSFSSTLEFSPERLEEIESRLSVISTLKRKYGGTIENVLEHLAESEAKLENLESAEYQQEELEKMLEALQSEYFLLAQQIHSRRKEAAKEFEKEVEKNLKKLALEKAKFEVSIQADESNLTSKGIDKVEFYFSANPGEVPKPLAKVASGGEASRLMLVLETTAKTSEIPKTMVFDEVDIGIGGRVAEAVGRKLLELSKKHQVLCVTHQPQVASLADTHFLVEKLFEAERTKVFVRKLGEEEKVKEIARMLAGEKITETAEKHARELLRQRKALQF